MLHIRQFLRGVLSPRRALTFAAVASATLVIPAMASATPPINDNFANATVIDSLPFSESLAVGEATAEPDEPSVCIGLPHSVWYRYQPQHDGWLGLGFTTDNEIAGAIVYKASGTSGFGDLLGAENCVTYLGEVTFFAQAGYTYYVQVGTEADGPPSDVSISLKELVSPPPNDDFDQATAVGSIPYVDGLDLHELTAAADDPTDCFSASNAWYRFTAPSSEKVGIGTYGGFGFSVQDFAVYTGTRGSLTNVNCTQGFGGVATFNAVAGTTYYIDVGWSTFDPEGLGTGTVIIAKSFSLHAPAINAEGRLTGSDVSISGSLACNAHGDALINVDVTQTRGRNAVHGQATIFPTCSPTSDPWTASVVPDAGRFRSGPATVTVSASACGQPIGGLFDCEQRSTTARVNFED